MRATARCTDGIPDRVRVIGVKIRHIRSFATPNGASPPFWPMSRISRRGTCEWPLIKFLSNAVLHRRQTASRPYRPGRRIPTGRARVRVALHFSGAVLSGGPQHLVWGVLLCGRSGPQEIGPGPLPYVCALWREVRCNLADRAPFPGVLATQDATQIALGQDSNTV